MKIISNCTTWTTNLLPTLHLVFVPSYPAVPSSPAWRYFGGHFFHTGLEIDAAWVSSAGVAGAAGGVLTEAVVTDAPCLGAGLKLYTGESTTGGSDSSTVTGDLWWARFTRILLISWQSAVMKIQLHGTCYFLYNCPSGSIVMKRLVGVSWVWSAWLSESRGASPCARFFNWLTYLLLWL